MRTGYSRPYFFIFRQRDARSMPRISAALGAYAARVLKNVADVVPLQFLQVQQGAAGPVIGIEFHFGEIRAADPALE
jgi:hypothetical protein